MCHWATHILEIYELENSLGLKSYRGKLADFKLLY